MLRLILTSLLVLAFATPGWAQEAESPTAGSPAAEADASNDDDDLYDDDDDLFEDEDEDAEAPDQELLEDATGKEELDETAEKSVGIEEIMVTSQRRRSTLQDVPVSVTAFSASEIEAQGIQDIKGISNFTPNLEIKTAFAASNPTLFIRGVGLNDYNANAASSVAVYQDGVYMNSPAGQLFQFFDVQSVEVLRGPQGSLYGRNASAGAIIVNSKLPTEDFELTATTSYGRFNDFEIEAAMGGNIVDDLIDGRLAVHYRRRDGIARNLCGGFDVPTPISACGASAGAGDNSVFVPAGLPTRLNNVNNWAARGLIRFRPDFLEMDWLFNLHGGQNLSQTTALFPAGNSPKPPDNPGESERFVSSGFFPHFPDFTNRNPRELYQNRVGDEFLDTLGASARGTMQFGDDLTFTTLSAYESAKRAVTDDFDSTPFSRSHNDTNDESWQVSQELSLDWQASDETMFNFGAMYLHANLEVDNLFNFRLRRELTGGRKADCDPFDQFDPDPPGCVNGKWLPIHITNPGQSFIQQYEQQTNAVGLFGHVNWTFLDNFRLDGGVRYSWEKKDFDILGSVQRIPKACPGAGRQNPAACLEDAGLQEVLDPNTGQRIGISGTPNERYGVPRLVFQPPIPNVVEQESETWSAPTGDISLSYSLTEDATTYAKYSRGWKPGGFNGTVVVGGDQCKEGECKLTEPIEAETVDGWEVGVKSYWFDRRLMINTSLFFQKYDNLQVFVLENTNLTEQPLPKLINANAAQIYGLEAEIFLQPMPGMNIRSQFGWLEAVYLDFTRNFFVQSGGGANTQKKVRGRQSDFSGNRLVANPRFSWSGDASHEFALGEGSGYLTPGFNWAFKTLTYFDPTEGKDRGGLARFREDWEGNTFLGQPSYWLLDARLAYTSADERFEITAWVRNLTDKIYSIDAFSDLENQQRVLRVIGEPRTFGITLWLNY